MGKASVPIPQEPIGENFRWREWFQRLSDKVFGTMSGQDSTNVSITGIVYLNGLDDGIQLCLTQVPYGIEYMFIDSSVATIALV